MSCNAFSVFKTLHEKQIILKVLLMMDCQVFVVELPGQTDKEWFLLNKAEIIKTDGQSLPLTHTYIHIYT